MMKAIIYKYLTTAHRCKYCEYYGKLSETCDFYCARASAQLYGTYFRVFFLKK